MDRCKYCEETEELSYDGTRLICPACEPFEHQCVICGQYHHADNVELDSNNNWVCGQCVDMPDVYQEQEREYRQGRGV